MLFGTAAARHDNFRGANSNSKLESAINQIAGSKLVLASLTDTTLASSSRSHHRVRVMMGADHVQHQQDATQVRGTTEGDKMTEVRRNFPTDLFTELATMPVHSMDVLTNTTEGSHKRRCPDCVAHKTLLARSLQVLRLFFSCGARHHQNNPYHRGPKSRDAQSLVIAATTAPGRGQQGHTPSTQS